MPNPDPSPTTRFAPGQSGNKRGRPRGAAGLARYLREQTDDLRELADLALAIARDPTAKNSERLAALTLVLDRALGRPLTTVDLHAELGGEVDVAFEARIQAAVAATLAPALAAANVESLRAILESVEAVTPALAPSSSPDTIDRD